MNFAAAVAEAMRPLRDALATSAPPPPTLTPAPAPPWREPAGYDGPRCPVCQSPVVRDDGCPDCFLALHRIHGGGQ